MQRQVEIKISKENRNPLYFDLTIVQARALYRSLQAINISQDAEIQSHSVTLENPGTVVSVKLS